MSPRVVHWLLLLLLTACGGTVQSSTDDDTESPLDGGGASDVSEAEKFKQVPLGQCESVGFDPELTDRPCNWIGEDDRCYDTRDEACDCNCPRDRDSTCSSGFYRGEGEATPVSCE